MRRKAIRSESERDVLLDGRGVCPERKEGKPEVNILSDLLLLAEVFARSVRFSLRDLPAGFLTISRSFRSRAL